MTLIISYSDTHASSNEPKSTVLFSGKTGLGRAQRRVQQAKKERRKANALRHVVRDDGGEGGGQERGKFVAHSLAASL